MFRLSILGVISLTAFAVAAPVPANLPKPKTNATVLLTTIKGDSNLFQTTSPIQVPVTKTAIREVEIMGVKVKEAYNYTEYQTTMITRQHDIKNYQLVAQNGKEITQEDFAKRMKEGVPTAFVQSGSDIDPEWRKLFADDVVFLIPLPPKK